MDNVSEDNYVLLGLNKKTRTLFYISSGTLDKVQRVKEVIQSDMFEDETEIVQIDTNDNIELKEDSKKLLDKFGYLLGDSKSENINRIEDEEDDLLDD